jgi:hypothetical protein
MSIARSPAHPLDQPIWTALTTRQQGFAEGGALARRYPPAVGPFADMTDMSPRSFAALGALMSGSEIAVLFTSDAVVAPADFKLLLADTGEQMIGTPAECSLPGAEPRPARRQRRSRDDGAGRTDKTRPLRHANA